VPDEPDVPYDVDVLHAENRRLRMLLGDKDAKIAELQERVERLERLISRNSLLTEQGPVFPQLDRLAVTPGLYRHRSWLGSGIGILRRWWCRCRVRWWRPGTGMSRSGWSGLTEWQRNR